MPSIALGFLQEQGLSALNSIRVLYLFSYAVVVLCIFWIFSKVLVLSKPLVSTAIVVTMPALIGLTQFSTVSLFSLALQLVALTFFIEGVRTQFRSNYAALFSGIGLGLYYSTRVDGLVVFALLFVSFIILVALSASKLCNKRTLLWIINWIGSFAIIASPWQYHLLINGFFLSPGVTANADTWGRGVIHLMVDDPKPITDLFLGPENITSIRGSFSVQAAFTNTPQILKNLGLNTLDIMSALASVKFIPIYFYFFVSAAFFEFKRRSELLPVSLLIFAICPYFLYGSSANDATRYMLVAFIPIAVAIAIGLEKTFNSKPQIYSVLLFMNLLLNAGYLMLGNDTWEGCIWNSVEQRNVC